jgi:iron complex outermembrane recepter protein
MKKYFFFVLFILIYTSVNSQVIISGNVSVIDEKKPISDASVYFVNNDVQVFTDEYGDFNAVLDTFELPVVQHIAFISETLKYDLVKSDMNASATNPYTAINIYLYPKNYIFLPVKINANSWIQKAPLSIKVIKGTQLNENNFGEDMPFLLESTPSAVVTSDAGNGVGYTGMRIRGSDATRVSVTVNGVPYNDAESQQTYWVDLPDFASSVDDIQIQRGVGTSTNGISAFGAAININTNNLSTTPFAKAGYYTGSFNLSKKMIQFGSGLINKHWTIEGRYSDVYAEGFIDRAYADLNSYFITAAYQNEKYKSVINVFSGNEVTYQSWGGVPEEIIDTNRTFNQYTYENQTDNYVQTHYQWHNNFVINRDNYLKVTFNYTKGKGYYEQYETDQAFADYGADDVIYNEDTITITDLISRKWLDSDFGGMYLQYEHTLNDNTKFNLGGAYYLHAGDHFGNIIWSEWAATLPHNYEWYRNDALKQDGNIFGQYIYQNNKLNVLMDIQLRNVNYRFIGFDNDGNSLEQQVNLVFFNPKAGVTLTHNQFLETYMFAGVSGKEPNRDDFVESSPDSRPSPEYLYNVEVGERIRVKGWQIEANYYLMYYRNQLVLTGEINDVGAYTRTNIPESYRTGIEIAWGKSMFSNKFQWEGNMAFSQNKITTYTEFIDDWDTGLQTPVVYNNTDIAFSPNLIGFNKFEFQLFQFEKNKYAGQFDIYVSSKYVGAQFADNTSDEMRMLNAYLLHDAGISYNLQKSKKQLLSVTFNLQNFTNTEYESNAWVYRYIYDNTPSQLMGFYPQAGLNWNGGIVFSF